MPTPILDIHGVTKQYGALRPLRIQALQVTAGEQVALVGFDQPAAEVLINLLTGAALPEAGSVAVLGAPTSDIADSDEWLLSLDRFGIVSDRAAVIEQFSVIQNLSLPFSLDVEPPPPDIRIEAERLAREVQISETEWDRPCHGLSPLSRARLRLARALALTPQILLLEHASATLEQSDIVTFGRSVRAVCQRRGVAAIVLTMDRDFAGASATRTLTLEPATGRLKEGFLARMGFRG